MRTTVGLFLAPITNYGVTYAVPSEHMGQLLQDTSVESISSLALRYLERVVRELMISGTGAARPNFARSSWRCGRPQRFTVQQRLGVAVNAAD